MDDQIEKLIADWSSSEDIWLDCQDEDGKCCKSIAKKPFEIIKTTERNKIEDMKTEQDENNKIEDDLEKNIEDIPEEEVTGGLIENAAKSTAEAHYEVVHSIRGRPKMMFGGYVYHLNKKVSCPNIV